MRVKVEMLGTTSLMMHGERLADQDDPITKEIAELNSKRKNKTDRDVKDISLLEWRGGVYADSKGDVVVPAANIVKCFKRAAERTRQGKKISGGISPTSMMFPLEIGGPRNIEKLIKDDQYFDRRMVGVRGSRIKRTRPIFATWAVTAEFELAESVINLSTFVNIVDLAGMAEGLCDGRVLGHGRFKAKVGVVK